MKIFLLILHFGGSKVTNQCLKSIQKHKVSFDELIVIDNSKNFQLGASIFLKEKMKVIKNEKNLGYAAGMNKGITYALSKSADYILLLNNDIQFLNNPIPKLVQYLQKNENVGIISSAIEFKKKGKTCYDVGGMVNLLFGKTKHKEVGVLSDQKEKVVDYVSGCFMIVKNAVFQKIGLLDERFFLYYEDVDFCLRARKENIKTVVLPIESVYHQLSASVEKDSKKAFYYQTKSAVLFGKKYSSQFLNMLFVVAQSGLIFVKNPFNGIVCFRAIIENSL